MGGCFSFLESEPTSYPTVPSTGPVTFKLLSQHFNSDVAVNTESGQKWLYIENKGGWFEANTKLQLQTYKTKDQPVQSLATCTISGNPRDLEMKRKSEWEEDSDDSDYSRDDLFDGDSDSDNVEHKVKLKWKVKRTATFRDSQGNEFCKMQFKVKGKSTASVEYEDGREDEGLAGRADGRRGHPRSTTKVKKVYHRIKWAEHLREREEYMDLDFKNGNWGNWDRSFDCRPLKAVYKSEWGRDDVTVNVRENVDAVKALIVGFAISYYFHPSRYAEQMNQRAVQYL